MAGGGAAHAALAPAQTGEIPPGREGDATSPQAWVAYNAQLRARLIDAGGGAFEEDFARALLAQVNQLRTAGGLEPYVWDDSLATCARAQAADMAERNYFGHASPEGFTHLDRVALLTRDLCGKTAENLAWRDYPGGTRPEEIEAMWEQSPGHRHNLLLKGFGKAGYGVVNIRGAYYAAGVYGDASIRLGQSLPLWIKGGPELKGALSGASPMIEQLALTPPFQSPTWMAKPSGKIPDLTQGVWQLRPLQPSNAGRYNVLSGPLFFVS